MLSEGRGAGPSRSNAISTTAPSRLRLADTIVEALTVVARSADSSAMHADRPFRLPTVSRISVRESRPQLREHRKRIDRSQPVHINRTDFVEHTGFRRRKETELGSA